MHYTSQAADADSSKYSKLRISWRDV